VWLSRTLEASLVFKMIRPHQLVNPLLWSYSPASMSQRTEQLIRFFEPAIALWTSGRRFERWNAKRMSEQRQHFLAILQLSCSRLIPFGGDHGMGTVVQSDETLFNSHNVIVGSLGPKVRRGCPVSDPSSSPQIGISLHPFARVQPRLFARLRQQPHGNHLSRSRRFRREGHQCPCLAFTSEWCSVPAFARRPPICPSASQESSGVQSTGPVGGCRNSVQGYATVRP